MISFLLALSIFATCFGTTWYLSRRIERDGTWHDYGTDRMRRWTGDRFEYRPMTAEEQDEYNSTMAW